MNKLITASRLGRCGRWGNQVFQYAFVRAYAKKYGLEYQVPPWIGQVLMGHQDPPITVPLPAYREVYACDGGGNLAPGRNRLWAFPVAPNGSEVVGRDFQGYAQFHTSYYAPQREYLQDLFGLVPAVWTRMAPAVAKLRRPDSTVIGLHLRRGDTGRAIFYLTPNDWYLAWLKEHWGRFKSPRLFIATEEPSDVEAFAEYNPIVASDLLSLENTRYQLYNYLLCDLNNPTAESMDWFPDWYLLTQCDVLVFGESTFSFSAAMMSQKVRECWRSQLSTQSFHYIDPWRAWPLVREYLEDHPGIPGTWYDSNSKWEGPEVVP